LNRRGQRDIARLGRAMSKALTEAAGGSESPLDPCSTAYDFIEEYNPLLDGRAFDWIKYKHLVPVYRDVHPHVTLQAGAQTGKTGYLLARLTRETFRQWGGMFGYYFPDLHLPRAFSTRRFRPFMGSSEDLRSWVGASSKRGKGTDAVLTRTVGPSTVFFLSVGGKSMTEGLPMQGIFFDEVRRMDAHDIQLAEERTSAQANPINIKVSTAFYPKQDINAAFLAGDQRYFHTICGCSDGVVLAKRWPDCVADLTKATPGLLNKVAHAYEHAGMPYLGLTGEERRRWGDACYICPDCGEIIVDPREGYWERHNPQAWAHSYQMPQLLSWTWPASRTWKAFSDPEQPLDIQEFHNSKLGLPYLDADSQLVLDEHLASCVNTTIVWPANQSRRWRKRHCVNTAMGVDCQAGYNVCVIKQRTESGKYRTIHLAVPHGDDPWKETGKLMHEYDVRCCVVDAMPHWNESRRFARQWLGRVFLAFYGDEGGSKGKTAMVSWKDRGKKADQRGDVGFKFIVNINRTTGLHWSLSRWSHRLNETPHPEKLVVMLPQQKSRVMLTSGLRVGRMTPTPICRAVYWPHQQSVAFRKVYLNDDAKRRDDFKVIAEHVGGVDPHFAHANLYADVALARISRATRPREV